MKFRPARLGLAQSLVALSVSLAVVLSSHTFVFASLTKAGAKLPAAKTVASQKQTDSPQSELRIISMTATATAAGVLLQWHTNSATDNLGFNVYRVKAGQRTRVNKEIIPGAVFAPGTPALMRGGYSYAWFDRGGTADATYHIESVSLQGTAKTHQPFNAVTGETGSSFAQMPGALSGQSANGTESTDAEKYYPAAETEISSAQGAIEDQWAIAAQTALRIAIKKDGWYRVTQPQMVAAGFNPTVDIRNLQLFVEAQEVAINTSQHSGPFGSGGYIEFYGRGLDIPTTDTRTYYLIAGTTRGKRVRGQIQLDGDGDPPILPPAPSPTPPPPFPGSSPPQNAPTNSGPILQDPIFFSWAQRDLFVMMESLRPAAQEQTAGAGGRTRDESVAARNTAPEANVAVANTVSDTDTSADNPVANASGAEKNPVATASGADKDTRSLPLPVLIKPITTTTPAGRGAPQYAAGAGKMRAAGKFRKSAASKKRKRSRVRRELKQERNHAVMSAADAPANFAYTAERKDRFNYFTKPLNGDAENWFGQVISSPVSQTINSPNPDLTAAGTAQLEIALQGVNQVNHQITVEFNNVVVGSFSFFGLDPASGGHPVQVFNIPVTQLQNGANTIRFSPQTCMPVCPDVSIVDYTKLTYPHQFRADAGALRFMLRGTHSVTVDGFSTPSVRLIDYTDPLNVGISRPAAAPSGPGFAITVPTSDPPSKPPRLLYAIADGQFDQPAGLSLNQPSTLNLNSNAGSFLIISHKNFIPRFTANVSPINTSLVAQRQSQGLTVSIVDVEDVYDEFGYGVHGPQAIRAFLQHAATNWATAPGYVIFAGDATYDPRNYLNLGNFDLVPTKLVDATFSENSSDDWLTDFDNDQIANIPVGRLPVRTVAEADTVISKIVNFVPANVPQNALLVADDPTGYFFNFETANDEVQALLPPSMTVQRVNVRIDGPALAKANIIAGFNQGRALVNYSGHGNVNVWSSSSIFFSQDATALTNGNALSFVVVMDCLNGSFQEPTVLSMSEALLEAPNGGAVAAFASSGLTFPDGQHDMSEQLYILIYGAQPIALGDAIKIAKGATTDVDVRSTWIFFGDPSLKIR